MKLSLLRAFLDAHNDLTILLPDGKAVPSHFHVTEVGEVTKHFIDCGGTVRHEKVVSCQLWSATDYDHRLKGGKLLDIIAKAESELGLGNLEIEVEYQGEQTIEKFGLEMVNGALQLTGKLTNCLAPDQCGVSIEKSSISLNDLVVTSSSCTPGSGCC